MKLHKPECHFSIRSILSVAALGGFLVVCLFVYLFVSLLCHSDITMKGGVLRSDFFVKRLGLIAWLRESMSRRSPSRRSASSLKVEEQTFPFSLYVR